MEKNGQLLNDFIEDFEINMLRKDELIEEIEQRYFGNEQFVNLIMY
jgi:hypothetical protein